MKKITGMNQAKRINWIDIAKGITILLVVFGHTMRGGKPQQIVYSFHVAAFFFLSGLTLKTGDIKKRIRNDFIRIMVPYYIFGIISIFIFAVLGKVAATKFSMDINTNVLDNVCALLYATSKGGRLQFNTPLWFLPCLFATKLLYYLLSGVFHSRHKYIFIGAVMLAVCGFVYTGCGLPYPPFSFNISLKLLPFLCLGKLWAMGIVSSGREQLRRGRTLSVGVLALTVACTLGAIFPKVNYSGDTFPNVLAFYTSAVSGCIGVTYFSMALEECRVLEYIGQKTLSILVMHKFPVLLFQTVGPLEDILMEIDTVRGNLAGGLTVTVISIAMCLVAEMIISRYFPYLLGEFKKRKYC